MQYTFCGASGLQMSKFALGAMNFGDGTEVSDAFDIMNRAVDFGINWFDTANTYGPPGCPGTSEEILGIWLSESPPRRNSIILSSKVFRAVGNGVNDRGLSAFHVLKSVDDTLRRLRTDHLDILFLHHVDRSMSFDALVDVVSRLISSGKVLYLGTSNFAGWHLAQFQRAFDSHRLIGSICEQSVYNLAERTVELEVIPACQALQMGFVAYSPLSNGLLARIDSGSPRQQKPRVVQRASRLTQRLSDWGEWCIRRAVPPEHVALSWLQAQPHVTSVLLGPRTVNHLVSAMESEKLILDEDDWQTIAGIWPGTGGPAPEAYAW